MKFPTLHALWDFILAHRREIKVNSEGQKVRFSDLSHQDQEAMVLGWWTQGTLPRVLAPKRTKAAGI